MSIHYANKRKSIVGTFKIILKTCKFFYANKRRATRVIDYWIYSTAERT